VPTQVIVLNGVGSVGKSSTARALQAIAGKPFLHVAMDAFIDMLPPAMIGHPAGLVFETLKDDEGRPVIAIHTGLVFARVMAGMRQAIAAMAAQGNNLIVDDVMTEPGDDQAYRALLADFDVRIVALHAPLAVLEAREAARGDRAIGLARGQIDRVHAGRAYDLEIAAAAATPEQCAALIRDAFEL
jgi:chloramphenicol 3-O phosphotransferase